MILCSDPKAQYLAYKSEIDQAIAGVLDSGWYILGQQVQTFEKTFADYVGVSFGIGVGSGTDAIHLALRACGVGVGDEVITVSHTAVATVAAIELSGATAVLVDIEPDFFTIDPEKLKSAVTKKTKAVIPVHLYGQAADMTAIIEIVQKHNLYLIEDCAQAHGAKYNNKRLGSFGHLSCFSFYPTKNLGALGDGGMVVTDDEKLAKKVRLLREYGWEQRFESSCAGLNTRLDEIQAAILNVKLKHLDDDNAKRKTIARIYDEQMGDTSLALPKKRENCDHVYHLYVARCPKRDELLEFLKENGIGAGIHYPKPVHLQSAYSNLKNSSDLSETEKICNEIISLPIYPQLVEADAKMIADTVKSFS
ncbi:MAG: DegT/DnrJ/EryC1/StrS family aminotransferase [Planctomycetes bacterium]|nr:DegT/DnrJ/EryC1/StrS family aminotransferase [Planctomycetota bacterium]